MTINTGGANGERQLKLPEPTAQAMTESLETLFMGRDVSVDPAHPWSPGKPDIIACYRDEDGVLRGAWMIDLPLAAAASCAMVTMPAARVGEAIEAGTLDPILAEITHEVVNVLGTFMNAPQSCRLRMQEVATLADLLDPVRSRHWQARTHFAISIAGYGAGRATWAVS